MLTERELQISPIVQESVVHNTKVRPIACVTLQRRMPGGAILLSGRFTIYPTSILIGSEGLMVTAGLSIRSCTVLTLHRHYADAHDVAQSHGVALWCRGRDPGSRVLSRFPILSRLLASDQRPRLHISCAPNGHSGWRGHEDVLSR
jgi:hypothetical protein